MNNPYIIGVSGCSGSGKTLFINKLMSGFKQEEVCLISQDNYYRKRDEQPIDENGIQNFDMPDSIDMDAFLIDIKKLMMGEKIIIKEYTFNNPNQPDNLIEFNPAPVIILEGIFIFFVEKIRKLIDLKVFIDAHEHIMLKRRILRDKEERGYDLADVLYRYEKHVMPTFYKYILPYKSKCDLVINNNRSFDKGVEVIKSHIERII